VVLVALTSKPTPGFSGRHLVLTIFLIFFVAEMLAWPIILSARTTGILVSRVSELTAMGAAAVALVVLQPNGVSELPGSAVVFMAGVALAPVFALGVGGAITLGVAIALASSHDGGADIASSVLLCAVLGLTGSLLHRYRVSQEKTELLLAELEEARDDQARAAAAEERARIARDLHDVLAHSLSGLSIQLEMVRKLLIKADVPFEVRQAIDRSAELAKEGLVGAREAVGALRREDRLGVEQLPALVEHFSRDVQLAVTYSVRGAPRPVSPEVGLALYRVTGEALTNVARHAVGAATRVELSFEPEWVQLAVTDEGGEAGALTGEGTGWGLAGVQERMKRIGGELVAGPSGAGWSVIVSAPA
jgi:signal transduction histidine kinase